MFMPNSMPSSTAGKTAPHTLNTPEFINRLAEEMHAKGDAELPLSHYVELVKMQLAGEGTLPEEANDRQKGDQETSDCFRAWALAD